MIRNNRIEIPC